MQSTILRLGALLAFVLGIQAHATLLGQERLSEPEVSELLQGKRIGALVHHASRDHQGTHVIDRLAATPGLELKMIFSPEHGYRTMNDENVADTQDPVTGLPVYSLYGPRKAPTAEMLAQLDLILIDLQDVGLRYYTYPATVAYTLKAAGDAHVPVVLLDRPNPLGGARVDGAILDEELARGGLTTIASIPTRHGMTLGELALYLNRNLKLGADLTVIPMADWRRTMTWEQTGMPWTPPSPALVATDQVLLYSIFGPLETGNFAVGRGQKNDDAFRVFGAPWVTPAKQKQLVRALQAARIDGLRFSAATWTPDRAAYLGRQCRGFRVELRPGASIAMNTFVPLMQVLKIMSKVLGGPFDLDTMVSMLGGYWITSGVEHGWADGKFEDQARSKMQSFLNQRRDSLLYPEP